MKRCIIVGGGHAGSEAAFELRKRNWTGEILILSSESYLPYHRPPLSKTFLTGESPLKRLYIKPPAAYTKSNIDIKLESFVTNITPLTNTITLSSGETLCYDKLLLCTGASPRKLTVPGAELANVFSIRTLHDIEQIAKQVNHQQGKKNIVMIGGGYIGLETAASFKKLGHQVTILERNERVLNRIAAEPIARYVTTLHASKGVAILTNKAVASLAGNGKVESVICDDGSSFPADLVVVGIGAQANSDLADKAGLITKCGRVLVNDQCQTTAPNIYAAGDCTLAIESFSGEVTAIESVPNAVQQAKIAVASICGTVQPQRQVPWFWSDIYDCKLQIVGLHQAYDRVIEREYSSDSKSYWYVKANKLIAVTCINCPSDFQAAKKILRDNINISLQRLSNTKSPIILQETPLHA